MADEINTLAETGEQTMYDFVDINGDPIEDHLCSTEDSHGLMCPEDKVHLYSIEEGAQVNVIDSADTTEFIISEEKELSINTIEMAKVTGLVNALADKVDSTHTHTIANISGLQTTLDAKVPTSRTVNGKALSDDISLTASDVGAAASSHTHSYVPTSRTVNGKALSDDISLTASDVGAAASSHTHSYLPLSGGTVTGATTFNSTVTIGAAKMTYNSTEKSLTISL